MALQAPEGTKDLLPDEAKFWAHFKATAADMFGRYGYVTIETPVFEQTELFVRGIGEATDVVSKEMFTAISGENLNKLLGGGTIKGKSRLSLRPEGTAGVVRAVVQHDLVPQGAAPAKLMYAEGSPASVQPGRHRVPGRRRSQRGRRGHHHAHALLRRHRHSRGRHAPSGELYGLRAVSPGVPRGREGVHGTPCCATSASAARRSTRCARSIARTPTAPP